MPATAKEKKTGMILETRKAKRKLFMRVLSICIIFTFICQLAPNEAFADTIAESQDEFDFLTGEGDYGGGSSYVGGGYYDDWNFDDGSYGSGSIDDWDDGGGYAGGSYDWEQEDFSSNTIIYDHPDEWFAATGEDDAVSNSSEYTPDLSAFSYANTDDAEGKRILDYYTYERDASTGTVNTAAPQEATDSLQLLGPKDVLGEDSQVKGLEEMMAHSNIYYDTYRQLLKETQGDEKLAMELLDNAVEAGALPARDAVKSSPEPFYLPILRVSREQIDAVAEEQKLSKPEAINLALREKALIGPEWDNVTMGQFGSWAEIGDSLVRDIKAGKIDIFSRPLAWELASRSPEERFDYKLAFAKELYGVTDYAYSQTELEDGQKAHVLFTDSYREQPYHSTGFSETKLDTILIDTKKLADEAIETKKSVEGLKNKFTESGEDFKELGIADKSASDLYKDLIAQTLVHEKTHLLDDRQISAWLRKGSIPIDLMYFFIDRPAKENLYPTLHEVAAISKELQQSNLPQYTLFHLDNMVSQKMNTPASSGQEAKPSHVGLEHAYAGRSLLPYILSDLGYADYVADRIIKADSDLNDYYPTVEQEKELREKIRKNELEFHKPEYLIDRLRFIDGLKTPEDINKLSGRYHDKIFGPTPQAEKVEIPESVIEEFESKYK